MIADSIPVVHKITDSQYKKNSTNNSGDPFPECHIFSRRAGSREKIAKEY